MFWTLQVESDLKEILSVQDQNGISGGEAIVDFYNPLELYCEQSLQGADIAWFENLNTQMNGKLCELIRPFLDSVYAGDWNYRADEYEFFKHRNPDQADIGEEKFRQTITDIRNKFTDIRLVLYGIEQMIHALRKGQFEATYWYESVASIREFEALHYTLLLHSKRGAQKIRIKID